MTLTRALELGVLTPTAKRLIAVLERQAKGYAECWSATPSLLKALGCCEKSFYAALRILKDLELIEVIRDYSKRSRRRILLLWKSVSMFPTEAPVVTGSSPVDSPAILPVTEPPPPNNPPIEAQLREEEEAASSSFPLVSNEEKTSSPEVVSKAHQVFGDSPVITAKVAEATHAFPEPWVSKAIDIAGRKKKPWEYVWGTLMNFRKQGGPPPEPPKPEDVAKRQREQMVADQTEDKTPLTEAQIEEARGWVATGDLRLKKLGRRILEGAGLEP